LSRNFADSVVPFGPDSYREGTSAAEGLDKIRHKQLDKQSFMIFILNAPRVNQTKNTKSQ